LGRQAAEQIGRQMGVRLALGIDTETKLRREATKMGNRASTDGIYEGQLAVREIVGSRSRKRGVFIWGLAKGGLPRCRVGKDDGEFGQSGREKPSPNHLQVALHLTAAYRGDKP